MKSLKANFVWNASFQLVRILIPLILTPYLTRTLGSSELGVYSYTSSIATYFVLFAFLGLNQYGTREIARHSSSQQDLSRTFCSIFAMQFGWGLVIICSYFIYCFLFSGDYFVCALVWVFWVIGEVIDVTWLFFGLEEFKITTIRNLVTRLISVVAIFLFVHGPSDTWLYCLFMALYFLFASLALWPFVVKKIDYVKPSLKEVLRHVKPNLILFAPVVSISLYAQLDKILLGNMSNMSMLGFYDQSEKVCQLPMSVIQALGTVMLPRMSLLISQGDTEKGSEYLDKSMWLTNVMAFAFCFGIVGIAPVFVPVFFGEDFLPCISLLIILAFEIPIIAWSNVFGIQCLLPHGKDRQYLASVTIAAAVNIVLNLSLIPILQATGTAIATLCTELVVVVVQMIFLRQMLPFGRYMKGALPYLLIGAFMAIVVYYIGTITGATILGLFIGVLAGIAVYAIMCVIWNLFSKDAKIELSLFNNKN